MSRSVVAFGALAMLIAGVAGAVSAQTPRPAEEEKAITEQNLFSPTRSRPTPPPAPKAPAKPVAAPLPSPPPPKFVLSGVVLDGNMALALLQEPGLTQNQVRVVPRDGEIGSYRLTMVLEDRVELEGPNGKITVPLSGPNRPAVSAATAAPGAPSRVSVSPVPGAARPAGVLAPSVPAVPPPAPSEPTVEATAPAAPKPAIQVPLDDPRRAEGFKALFDALRQGQPSAAPPAKTGQ